jgi:hypothetical protein
MIYFDAVLGAEMKVRPRMHYGIMHEMLNISWLIISCSSRRSK